jgi:hypothetical protein
MTLTLLTLFACAENALVQEGDALFVAGGMDAGGSLVATVESADELLLAVVYLDGIVLERDDVPDDWQMDGEVEVGMAMVTQLDPGGLMEVAHPRPGEAIVIFREDSEWRYDCFTDDEGPACSLQP